MKIIKGLSIALLGWWLLTSVFSIAPYILPSPVDVIHSIINNFQLLLQHTSITLIEILIGFTAGASLAIIAALTATCFPKASGFIISTSLIKQAIPTFVLAPIFVLWFGYGFTSKILVTGLIVYFPVLVSFYEGLKNIPQSYLDLAKIMNAKPKYVLRHIKIPAALPSLTSGLKLGIAAAPMGAIIGEWVGAKGGLGFTMMQANAHVDIDLMFACVLFIGLVTAGLYLGLSWCLNCLTTRTNFIYK